MDILIVIIEKGKKLSDESSHNINYEFEEWKNVRHITCKQCDCKFIYKWVWELGIKGQIVSCPNKYCTHRTSSGLKKKSKIHIYNNGTFKNIISYKLL